MPLIKTIQKYWSQTLLGLMILVYISYFSWFTVLRYQTLYAHYYDLGIMHQTVYNTFMSLKTGDYSRFLELTNPHGFDQVKRMAVHNDMFLALLAPFYFIYSGPETLLIIQTIAVALGAVAVYGIGRIVFENIKHVHLIALFFSFAYLMYPALQRANQFDFHAVVIATPLLLFMYYWYLKKNYVGSMLCALFALLTKEQIGLTVAFFGLFVLFQFVKNKEYKLKNRQVIIFAFALLAFGTGWFILSMTKIIPYFRQGAHFAIDYFGDFGDSPKNVFIGLVKNPLLVLQYIFRKETYEYMYKILGPVVFLSIFSPIHFAIAVPELAINILSKSEAMRDIYFHYTAVVTPFVMISAIYGMRFLLLKTHLKKQARLVIGIGVSVVFLFSFLLSPLPYALGKEIHPLIWPVSERFEAYKWQKILDGDNIKVMTSGHLGPVFAARRYFYNLTARYDLADYIVLYRDDVYNGYQSDLVIPVYESLIKDKRFLRIYKNEGFEVYKKK